ncbi:alpha/beta hydrolase [Microbacterium caowuchunii]|uniref:Alpha/beta hydrolase n=2 Tax=Microbacterium caowuchunii TaxID=2614638 RepID=A0A5N0TGS1_9MICO|nr:alpha/beta hydrolase [Microbacterium caowuchunii]
MPQDQGMVAARTAAVAGLTFRIHSSVHPDPAAVYVLVHGIGMSHRYLRRLHAVLAQRATVHSLDMPGFGGTPKPRREVPVEEMAAALGGVVVLLGSEPVVAVGHSMGSQWVVELGATRPDLVSHVVVIGPVTDDHRRNGSVQALALGLDSCGEPPAANAIVFTDYVRCGPRWYLRQLGPMLTYPIERRVAELSAPLLIIRGGADPVATRQWCRRLRDAAGTGRLVEVPGRPHIVQWGAPRAVASALRAFVLAP